MASRISGITIEIGGDTSKLQDSLKGVDSQLRKTQSNLRDVNKLLKLDPSNTELLTQKQKNLEKAISGTEDRLKELKDAQNGVSKGSEQWDALQREIIATEQDLKGLKKELSDFGSVTAQKIKVAGENMEQFGNKVSEAGEKLAPLSAAGSALLVGLGKLGLDAINAADNLNTLAQQTGFTTDEIQKMQYASDLVDVSFEDISGALKKLKSKMDPANETLQALGVSVTNADGSLRNANDVFYDSIEALSKIENETERDQVAMELFGKGADSLAGIIDDGGASLKKFGKEAEDMGLILSGETLEDLNDMNDSLDTLKAQLKVSLGKLGSTVAKTFGPSFKKAADWVSKLADKIGNMNPKTLKLITAIAGVAAAISPLLIVGGKLISGVGKVMQLAPKIAGIMNPTTLGITVVVAAIAALATLIYENWDEIVAWTKNMVDKVKTAWNNLKTAVTGFVDGIKTGVTNAWNNMKTAVSDKMDAIKNGVTSAWDSIKSKVTTAAGNVKDAVSKAWDGVKSASSTAWSAVKDTAVEKFKNIKQAFDENGGGIKGTAAAVITAVKEKWTFGFDLINNLTGGKLDTFKAKVTAAWDNVKSAVSTAMSNLKGSIAESWSTISATVSDKVTSIKTSVTSAWNTMKASVVGAVNGLKSTVLGIWDNLKGGISARIATIKGYLDGFKSKFTDVKLHIQNIIDRIKSAFNFSWSFPHINLPHFRVYGGVAPYGLGGRGSLPTISIDWYKKAYENPVMFTSPTVLQTPNGAKGFGDGHGAEIVLGLNKLRQLVGSSGDVTINVYGAPGQSVDALADAIQKRFVELQRQKEAVYA